MKKKTRESVIQNSRISGDLVTGGVRSFLALGINVSSLAPKLSIVILKMQRAITSIAKTLNWLKINQKEKKMQNYCFINYIFAAERTA